MLSVDACLEVQVFGRCTSRTSGQGNGLASLYRVATLYQILGVVAVDGFQSRGVAHHDDVAIGTVGFRHTHNAIESATDGVVGTGLDIDTRVSPAAPSVGRNDFAAGQREAVIGCRQTVQMNMDAFTFVEQSRSGHPDVVLLHVRERRTFFLCVDVQRQQADKDNE